MVYLETPEYLLEDNLHTQIISQLEKRLLSPSREMISERIYYLPDDSEFAGKREADILIIDNVKKYAYAIEVKTTDTTKARTRVRKQLSADKEYLSNQGIKKIHLFYAYQNKDKNPKRFYKIERIFLN